MEHYQGSRDPHGPQNGPWKANFRGPLVEKGPPESLHGPMDELKLTAWFHYDQKSVPKWLEGLDNAHCRNGIDTLK